MKKQFFIFWLFSFFCIFAYGQSNDAEIEKRLLGLQTTVPLHYNDIVADCIQKMLHENRMETQKLLEDFLPYRAFFQGALLKAGLPQELCYLPLMLQKMQRENNQFFDMAGIWNIPFLVAVKYGLTVNNQIDERYDIQKSTQAAIAYLSAIENEQSALWEVIIAYSNSLSALEAAKIRSNSTDIWALYEKGKLPNKNCIPYFIACLYLANFYETEQFNVNLMHNATENTSIKLKKEVSIQGFIKILNIEEAEFKTANPVFVGNVLVPNHDIRIPVDKQSLFVQMEDSIYSYIVDTVKKTVEVSDKKTSSPVVSQSNATNQYYTVQSGDILGKIAQKFGTSVEQLKTWNNLSSDVIQLGQKLIVSENGLSLPAETTKPTPTPPPASADKKVVYTVKKGDTLGAIALKYNVNVEDIKKWNNLKNDNIGIDQKLIILK